MKLISEYMTSTAFISQIRGPVTEAESTKQQSGFNLLTKLVLILLHQFSDLQKSEDKNTAKKGKHLAEEAYDVIDAINEVLSISGFVKAVTELMKHSDPNIRRRALQLFNEKISVHKAQLSSPEVQVFLAMLPALHSIISSKTDSKETIINKQTALFG